MSHEAIYQAIFVQAKGTLKQRTRRVPAQRRAKRQPQGRHVASGSKITDMVNISERPPEAADRAVPGDWEGDLDRRRQRRPLVATLVERSTRYGMLIKIDNKTAEHVAQRIAQHMTTCPATSPAH